MDPVERFDADFAKHARQFRMGLAEIGRPFTVGIGSFRTVKN